METKICTKCKVPKLLKEFFKNRNKKDGLHCWCKECVGKYQKEYQKEYYEKRKKQKKKYREKNRERTKEWYKRTKKDRIKYRIKYNKLHREKLNNYERERRKSGLICKLHKNISLGIWRSLKNGKNGHSWEDLVGYTLIDLKKHLEAQFKEDMTWENYGKNGWEIDHRIPISLFNIKGPKSKGFKACWALENLQPMWAKENKKKNDKLFYQS